MFVVERSVNVSLDQSSELFLFLLLVLSVRKLGVSFYWLLLAPIFVTDLLQRLPYCRSDLFA